MDVNQIRQLYSYILGVPFVNLEKEMIPKEILQIIPEPIAKKYKIVAFKKNNRELKVAMLNPEDLQTIDFIRKKTGLKISPCITTEEGIANALKQYEQSLKAEFGSLSKRAPPKFPEKRTWKRQPRIFQLSASLIRSSSTQFCRKPVIFTSNRMKKRFVSATELTDFCMTR